MKTLFQSPKNLTDKSTRAESELGSRRASHPRKRRICLATAAPFLGGAEVAAERLALGLQHAGHEVLVLAGRSGIVSRRLQDAGLNHVVRPMPMTDRWHGLRYLRARSSIRRVLKRFAPDVIHSNDLPTHQILSDAARTIDAPRVCHHRFPFDRIALDWMLKFGAERHLFVSNALKNQMHQEGGRILEVESQVVHDGLLVRNRPTEEEIQSAKRHLGLPSDRVVVTFAGQLIPRKGVADLIRGWALLPETLQRSALLVIVGADVQGDGTYSEELRRLASGLPGEVRFVGFQTHVSTWLVATDVAVVPSHVEPLGNATLEAMSHAVPVIATNVGGIPEMVVSDETGLLVPPHDPPSLRDAFIQLLPDAERRRELGQAGWVRCHDVFSIDAHVENVLHAYELAEAST